MLPAVILAAGASTRMGRPKAVLPVDRRGDLFVTRLMRTLAGGGADDVIVVVGKGADLVREKVAACPVAARVVANSDWEQGQLSSLVAALNAVDRPGVRGLIAVPVDMPLVAPATVRAVIEAYDRGGHLIVRPARGGRHGHPVIFDRALFEELRRADVSAGARAVVAAHRADVLDLPIEDEGAFIDIDTPQDYARYIGLPLEQG